MTTLKTRNLTVLRFSFNCATICPLLLDWKHPNVTH
nr:MAG TPA: hypothetical protein [Caudoviricetes sp.]